MVESEAKRIRDCVEGGRYEESLSVGLDASRPQINRAHMKLLARFRDQPAVRALINKAKSRITSETDLEKGRRLTRIGLKEEAVRYLVSGLEKNGNADDHLLAGQTLEQTWRLQAAIPYFERAIELRGDATDYLWLGNALSGLHQYERAAKAFEEAVRLRGSADDRRLLGSLYMKMGELERAEKQLRAAVALGDTLSSQQLLVECSSRISRRKIETAIVTLASVVTYARKHPIAWALAGVLAASGVLLVILT